MWGIDLAQVFRVLIATTMILLCIVGAVSIMLYLDSEPAPTQGHEVSPEECALNLIDIIFTTAYDYRPENKPFKLSLKRYESILESCGVGDISWNLPFPCEQSEQYCQDRCLADMVDWLVNEQRESLGIEELHKILSRCAQECELVDYQ